MSEPTEDGIATLPSCPAERRVEAHEPQPSMREMWSIIQEQREEITQQREEITELKHRLDGHGERPIAPRRRGSRMPLSRRGLLRVMAASVVGVAAAEVAGSRGVDRAAASTPSDEFIASNGTNYGFLTTGTSYSTGVAAYGSYTGVEAKSSNVGLWGKDISGSGTAVQGSSYTQDGTTTLGNGIGVHGESGGNYGVYGTSDSSYGVYGTSNSNYGVYGYSASKDGVLGDGAGGNARGVHGISTGNDGVYGESSNAIGVHGMSTGDGSSSGIPTAVGVLGQSRYNSIGVEGITSISGGFAPTRVVGPILDPGKPGATVLALDPSSSKSGVGVRGVSHANTVGVAGVSYSDSTENTLGSGYGVKGYSGTSFGVFGSSTSSYGICGTSNTSGGVRAISTNYYGLYATSSTSTAVYGASTGQYGGYFVGALAPIRLAPASTAGAPSTSGHSKGELYVDTNGVLYYFTGAAWKTVQLV